MTSHFVVLWRYHYVNTTATTFTTRDLKEKKIWISCGTLRSLFILLLRSLPLVLEKKNYYNFFIIFYYIHYAMVMSKRSKISFQLYVHDAMIMKNIRFTLSFIKNTLIATTSTTPRSWQKSIFFLFSTTTFTTPWWWEKSTFSPVANCYYVHYVAIMSATFTTPWSWQKYMFSFQHYVYYMMIIYKKYTFFHFSTTLSRS